MKIKINKHSAGVRLDNFLVSADSVWENKPSRGQIQKLIKQEIIKIDGQPVTAHRRLKPGDVINIEKRNLKTVLSPRPSGTNVVSDFKVEIIDETDDCLVINKPAGLAVQAKAGPTLVAWVTVKYPDLKKVGDDPARPGIVHRLDKDVSGLMVLAKTQAAFEHLKKQFQTRTTTKEYIALVHGQIQKDSDDIDFPIKRSQAGYKMAAIPRTVKGEPAENARLAHTEFQIITRLINYTLLRVKIKTGRTHQIRVHLAAYDHPVVGDNIYGTARARRQNKKLGLKRIFLIASHLAFTDLNNQPKDYQVDLTEELKNVLKTVK